MRTLAAVVTVFTLASIASAPGQERKTRDMLVQEDRAETTADGFWIYNDLPMGLATAKQSGKPLLVVFRCIPCDACAQLDSEIVERDPAVRELLEEFVCVRIVHANGMDLSQFQFDYDQSFAAFLMNADKTIYGRYGTRSHQTQSEDDVSLEGFAAALNGALELHKQYPGNRSVLSSKRSQDKPAYPVPEEYPSLRGRFGPKLQYEANVAQSCIHCHQVGEVERETFRNAGKPIPEKLLFPYPHPRTLGLIMDPKQKATVQRVMDGSAAARDDFRAGDAILTLSDQPLLSIADIQWVLHNAPAEGKVKAQVLRDGETIPLEITLARGWRRRDNLSWRATSWSLRRMTTGGLLLEEAPESLRHDAELGGGSLALQVRHVGQYGPHALAQRAGFRQGDLVISVAGRTDAMRETDLLAFLVNRPIGQPVPFTVLRDGNRIELTLKTQE